MMDSFPGHLSNEVLQLLGQNGVKVETFPAHTSSLFQELDLVLFGALKRTKILLRMMTYQSKQSTLTNY